MENAESGFRYKSGKETKIFREVRKWKSCQKQAVAKREKYQAPRDKCAIKSSGILFGKGKKHYAKIKTKNFVM